MALSRRIKDNVPGMIADVPPLTVKDGKIDEQQINNLNIALKQLVRAINGALTFGDASSEAQTGNIDGQWKTFFFAAANTAYEMPHGLGRIPIGILQCDVDQNGAVVRGINRGDWNDQRMYLSCSQANTTALVVVI